MEGLLSRKEVV